MIRIARVHWSAILSASLLLLANAQSNWYMLFNDQAPITTGIPIQSCVTTFFNSPTGAFSTQQVTCNMNQNLRGQMQQNYYQAATANTGPIECIKFTRNCKHLKYRTFDGTCNNIQHPTLGSSNTVFSRLATPNYSDGVERPSSAKSGNQLPNARALSILFFPDVDILDPKLTLAAMQWGQIMTHDMALSIGTTTSDQLAANCCTQDGRDVSEEGLTARWCFPIMISQDDILYTKYQQRCMSVARTLTDRDVGCTSEKKPADQIISVSHYMDASFVYGYNDLVAASLRTFQMGKLRSELRNGEEWPPMNVANRTTSCPVRATQVDSCYLAGDLRVNQNPQLTVIQIVLLREHNRIAEKLHHLNPHWNDEKIYQETRKIVIGEVQFISYYEWLPLFFGTRNLMNYGIIYDPRKYLYVNDYNELVDPRTTNEHSTAAFRAFHTNIQGYLKLIKEEREAEGEVRLSDFFNNPSILEYNHNFDNLARGLTTQMQRNSDQFHTEEITDFLFRDTLPFGLDLKAIDIQRGRDHGLPSYNTMREYCGLKRAESFLDFNDYLTMDNIQKLQSMYEHPDDVDLNVGGLLEKLIPHTLAGPTYTCIILEQFYRTRVGDRYFFENDQHKGAFTKEQLIEIKKSSFARLMCDNTKAVHSMQPKAFLKISPKNPLLPCSDFERIPAINLEAWREVSHENQEFGLHFFK